jgi:tubulin monoglycylase TTLL3/8
MLDSGLNPWLIEVNSSPSLDYSTHVTERLVKMVLEDIVKVVIDYGWAPLNRKKNIDTGLWKCIFRRNQVIDKPQNSFNLKLECKGKAIKKHLLTKV